MTKNERTIARLTAERDLARRAVAALNRTVVVKHEQLNPDPPKI